MKAARIIAKITDMVTADAPAFGRVYSGPVLGIMRVMFIAQAVFVVANKIYNYGS
jgi:hypothetical protein